MQNGNVPLVALLILVAIVLIVAIWISIIRWVYKIKRQLWIQKQQLNVLLKIAEKLGVNVDAEMVSIKEKNNNPDDHQL